ncbi:hypothetical protein LZF95_15040 [Algoriphagus sp. AGSA1]|uniref:hypothetical protein n=1 Tax=Algoriphagus sp. AGSA1 TaxID=2907213 RepID=UPI001F3FF3B3|nr:hypothetical protein [Algoriphagus sp. AGSA1]MCE7055995.1 hypothetical protein [Algoriphagus sp. AGSA1]
MVFICLLLFYHGHIAFSEVSSGESLPVSGLDFMTACFTSNKNEDEVVNRLFSPIKTLSLHTVDLEE